MNIRIVEYLDSYRAFGVSLELRNPKAGSFSVSLILELLIGKIEINIEGR